MRRLLNILALVLCSLALLAQTKDRLWAKQAGGSITPTGLKRVLDQYSDSLSQGKSPQRVRIVLE
jgi:hypothetical protein